MEAAKQNRCGHRDATAILVAYRHGFRASELVVLRWDDIDLTTGRLHVRRAKGGDASVHPISARESRALRKQRSTSGVAQSAPQCGRRKTGLAIQRAPRAAARKD
jgi:integrase